mmetsp:Transcript_8917/g.20469  ORF Transcript_8917/g.20469 Transcript_8917/m.20469 type:complete len:214 (-) Transcript_8917:577-1218(-)
MYTDQHASLGNGLPGFDQPVNADITKHHALLRDTSTTNVANNFPNLQCVHCSHDSVRISQNLHHCSCSSVEGQLFVHGVDITVLCLDHFVPLLPWGAALEHLRGPLKAFLLSLNLASEYEELARALQDELSDVRRAFVLQHLDRFFHFEPISRCPTKRCVHIGQKGTSGDPSRSAEVHHALGELPSVLASFHECRRPKLYVEDQGRNILSKLL